MFVRCLSQTVMRMFNRTKYKIYDLEFAETNYSDIYSRVYENLCWEPEFIKKICDINLSTKQASLFGKIKKIGAVIKFRKQLLDVYFDNIVAESEKFLDLFETQFNEDLDKGIENLNNLYIKLRKKMLPGVEVLNGFKPTSDIKFFYNICFGDFISDIYAFEVYNKILKNNIQDPVFHIKLLNIVFKHRPFTNIFKRIDIALNKIGIDTINLDDWIDFKFTNIDLDDVQNRLNLLNSNRSKKENNENI